MNRKTLMLVALVLPVLAIGLPGCRTTKRQAASAPPAAAAPAPMYTEPAPPMAYGNSGMPSSPPPPGSWEGGFESVPAPSGAFPAPSADPFGQAPGATAGGGDIEMRIQQAEAARREAQEQLALLRRKVAEVEDSRSQPVRAPSAQAVPTAAGEAQARAFASDLRTRTTSDVEVNGSVVIVRFSDSFQPGSATLKGDAAISTALMATSEALMRNPSAQVSVIGHSDGQPIQRTKDKWTDNVHLSRERAQTVAQALARNGVPTSRMAVDGRGSVEPIVFPERNAGDRARNRRVEVHVRF